MARAPRRSFAIGAAAAALVLAVAVFVAREGEHATPTTTTSARVSDAMPAVIDADAGGAQASRFAWPRGTRYVYRVEWRGEHAQALLGNAAAGSGAAATGRVDFDVDLVLTSFGPRAGEGGGHLLAARVGALRRHALVVLGQDVLASAEAVVETFGAGEALVEIDRDGRLVALYYAGAAPPLFEHVMQAMLAPLDAMAPANAYREWNADDEVGPSGRARVHYAVDTSSANDAGGVAFTRSRVAYTELAALPATRCPDCTQLVHGGGRLELDPAGHWRSIVDDETLRVATPGGDVELQSTSHSSMTLIERTPGETPAGEVDLNALTRRRAGEIARTRESARRLLVAQVGSMTTEKLVYGVQQYAHLGRAPTERGWLVRAAGLLELQPEACDRLFELFESRTLHVRTKALVLDLLASAGTPKAQATMRAALATAKSQVDSDVFLQLLQRFSFITDPERASAELVAREYDDASARAASSKSQAADDARYAAAYTLGAMTGALFRRGDAQSARELSSRLRGDLAKASSPVERRELLTAIGAAAMEENGALIAEHARSPEVEVRAAAMRALTRPPSRAARGILLEALSDPESKVRDAAMRALARQPLDPVDVRRLRERVTRGELARDLDAPIAMMLSGYLDGGDDVRAILEAQLARAPDARRAERFRTLLAHMPRDGGAPPTNPTPPKP